MTTLDGQVHRRGGQRADQGPAGGVGRLALRPEEAAQTLGVSRSFFFAEILPELRVMRRGRVRLIPIRALEEWLDRNAARTLT